MPAKIRLQRYGKKGMPYYHIVIADGRAPRDGKYIENIGTYNPLTKPAEIILDINKALEWLENGAQPTETAKAILSYKGVMYKYHLSKGVKKGALTLEQAEAKFQTWAAEKEAKINSKKKETELSKKELAKKRIETEVTINEAKAAAIAKKKAKEDEKAAKETAQEESIPEVEVTEGEAEIQVQPEAQVEVQPTAQVEVQPETQVETPTQE